MTTHSSLLRPLFDPSTCSPSILPLRSEDGSVWLPLISCTTNCPSKLFQVAVTQLIHHPEYNSTLILRSDTLSESTSDFPDIVPQLTELHRVKLVHRKLLPRRPGRDASIEQFCTLYSSDTYGNSAPSVLLLTPVVPLGSSLPYYHPAVVHLAFRYIPLDPPVLHIEVLPLPNTPTHLDSRLYRTCLTLLDALHRYCWGAATDYKKRVAHDCLISRETYQDAYLIMRERHKHLVEQWHEVTDPIKHVFEDIGIATYLMLLWKDTFTKTHSLSDLGLSFSDTQPWHSWPRPPGGFLDFGCGNGLLTHILTEEGYSGQGIDVRARSSWTHYPESTRAHLHVHAFDPTDTLSSLSFSVTQDSFLQEGVFIIGNHADELTPWIPVLSTLHAASGYLSIPCCAWTFDMRYERSSTPTFPIPAPDFADTLNLAGDGNRSSSYSMYRIWLASLSLHCGWQVECEMLRIPSTRNWAIIGRKRTMSGQQEEEAKRNVTTILNNVRERGLFKSRQPEGKARDH